jgi:hypothetical protein
LLKREIDGEVNEIKFNVLPHNIVKRQSSK